MGFISSLSNKSFKYVLTARSVEEMYLYLATSISTLRADLCSYHVCLSYQEELGPINFISTPEIIASRCQIGP